MSKNQIFTSPLGIGLGIGIGTAIGSIIIGAITYTIFKYSKGKGGDEGEGYSDGSRSSSMFSVAEDSIHDGNSEGENNALTQFTDAFNNPVDYGHRKVKGGKCKKIKRKRKRKNKLNTLKKV